jgi:hypothetical protein
VSAEEFLEVMGSYIATSLYTPQVSEFYILRPVMAEMRIRRSLLSPEESDIPKLSVNILIDEMRISLEASQYQDLLMLGSLVSSHRTLGKYADIRPTLRPLESPSAWWAYAIEAVRRKRRRRSEKRSWSYLVTRRECKLKYIDLYAALTVLDFESQTGKTFNIGKSQQLAGPSIVRGLSASELDQKLLELEDSLTLEEVFLFRTLADRELFSQAEQSSSSKKRGWWGLGWLYSSKFSAEEEAFLRYLDKYSDMIEDVAETPQAYVKSFLNFELRSCTVSLAGRQFTGLKASLLRVHLDRVILQRQITPSYSQTYLALSSFEVTDPFTPCKKFSQLLRPVNSEETFYEIGEAEAESFPDANDGFPQFSETDFSSPPVLMLNMEKGASLKLKVNVETTELLYNHLCLERIINFFRSPEALQFYKLIELQTINQISSIKHRTQAKLDFIMKHHVDLQLDLHMSAPIVTVPLNPLSEDSALLVVDFGLLRVTSDTRQLASPRKDSSEFDISEFYDRYEVEVSDLSVILVAPERHEQWALLDKFSIKMALEKCILPLDPNYSTVRVTGNVSSLKARISKLQYSMLKQFQPEDSSSDSSRLSFASVDEAQTQALLGELSGDDEDIFFDADEGSPMEPATPVILLPVHPDKEHLALLFSIDELQLQLYSDEHDASAALDSRVYGVDAQVCILQSRKIFRTKLRRVKVEDELGRVLVDSDELSDLITLDFTAYQAESLLLASVSHLQMQYYDEPIKWLLNLAKPDRKYFKQVAFKSPKKLHAELKCFDIRARVNHDNSPLLEVVVVSASVVVDKHLDDEGEDVLVQVGAVEGIDFLTRTPFFTTSDSDLLTLRHWSNSRTLVEVHPCRLTALMEMIRQLHLFVLESAPVLFLQKLKKRRSQMQSADEAALKHKFEFKAFSPIIALVDAGREVTLNFGECKFTDEADIKSCSIYGASIQTNLPQSSPLLSSLELEAKLQGETVTAKLNRAALACSTEQVALLSSIFKSYTEHFAQLNKILHAYSAGVAAISAEAPFGVAAVLMRYLPDAHANEACRDEAVQRSLTKIVKLEQFPVKFSLQLRTQAIDLKWVLENSQVLRTELRGLELDIKQREDRQLWWKASLQSITTLIERGIVNEYLLVHQLCKEDTAVVSVSKISPTHLDIDIAYLRVIITPFAMLQLLLFKAEVSRLLVKSQGSSSWSGSITKLQVCISENQTYHIDEEDSLEVHSAVALDLKQLILLELSAEFEDKDWEISSCSVALECTNLVDAGIDLQGRLIVQPFKAVSQVEDQLQLLISKIEVDLSVEQIVILQSVLRGFQDFKQSSERRSVPCLNAVVQLQQFQISLSAESLNLKQPDELYFTLLLDEPLLTFPADPSDPVRLKAFLTANYFNQQVCDWEPLIEQAQVKLSYSIEDSGVPEFSLKSYQEFNVNLSTAMISCLQQFLLACTDKEGFVSRSDSGAVSRHRLMSVNSSLILKNETGQQLKYWVGTGGFSIFPNGEQPLDFTGLDEQTSLVSSFRGQMKARRDLRNKSVSLQVDELPRINEISLDKQVPTVYPIFFHGHELGLICSLKVRHGERTLIVKSPIEIKNNLPLPIEVRLTMPLHQSSREEYTESVSVEPMSSAPVPITSALFNSMKIRVLGFDWSERISSTPETPVQIVCPNKAWGASVYRKDSVLKPCSIVMNTRAQPLDKIMTKCFEFDCGFTLQNLLCCDLEFAVYRHNRSIDTPLFSLPEQNMPKFDAHERLFYGECSYTGRLFKGERYESLEVSAIEVVSIALRLPGYEWSRPMVLNESIDTIIFQFSKKSCEQVNVFVESDRSRGSLKLEAYAQFWLENHTSLPILFQHRENRFMNVPMFLPYHLDDFLIEGQKVKDFDELRITTAFESSLRTKARHTKPWLQHLHTKKPGFGSLSAVPSDVAQGSGLLTKMFSAHCDFNFAPQASIRVANSDWSEHFNLMAVEPDSRMLLSSTSVKAYEPSVSGKAGCIYEVAMSLSVPEAPFERTKLVKFMPRFVLSNRLPFELLVTQFEPTSDTDGVCRLQPLESTQFHWPDASRHQSLCVKLEDHGWQWSGSFNIDKADDFFLRLRNRYLHTEAIVQATVSQEGSTFQVVFADSSVLPPYRIENLSMENVLVFQTDVRELAKPISPFEIVAYAWDEPMLPNTLKVLIAGASSKSNIDLGAYKLDTPSSYGPINLKKHGNHPPHALYIEITVEGACKVLKIRHEQSEEEYKQHKRLMKPKGNFVFTCRFKQLGVSLLDLQPQELLYISLDNLQTSFARIQHDTKLELALQSFQVDNQLPHTQFPVILRPHSEVADLRVFSFKLHMRENDAKDVTYFKQLVISPAHVDMCIDGDLIERLLQFSGEVAEITRDVRAMQWFKEAEGPKKKERKLYFDKLVVSNVTINLSLSSVPSMFNQYSLSPLRVLLIILANVGNVYLDFPALTLQHRQFSGEKLRRELATYYTNGCKSQLLSIILSSDILGNPNELFRQLQIGFRDFVTNSSQATLGGFAEGVSSLVKHTAYGASNSTSRFLDSLRKGIQSLYQDEQPEQQRRWSVVLALLRTALLVPNILVSIASSTASHVRDSIHQQPTGVRRRPPRCLLASRLLTSYSYDESLGQYILATVRQGQYLREDLQYHFALADLSVLITSKRILGAQVDRLNPEWEAELSNVTHVKQEGQKLLLYYFEGIREIGLSVKTECISGAEGTLQTVKAAIEECLSTSSGRSVGL